MSKIYEILKNYIVENEIQYKNIIESNVFIPKEITTSIQNIASENPEQIQSLIEKIKSLEDLNERMAILAILIDYYEDAVIMTLWHNVLISFNKDVINLGEISQ